MARCKLRLAVLVALALALPAPAHPFYKENHAKITAALDFLDPRILALITAGNLGRDDWWLLWRKTDVWHFNDCAFEETAHNIRRTYREVVAEITGDDRRTPNPHAAAELFGMLLHTIQDFYSHSNWVELLQPGETGACAVPANQPELVDQSLDNWPTMTPWSELSDVVIVEDNCGRDDALRDVDTDTLWWCRENKKARVFADGAMRRALVSGKVYYLYGYALPWSNKCPTAARAMHWDRNGGRHELHKDGFGQHFHDRAMDLATRQTKHEWCRLLQMVHEEDREKGVRRLFATWVADPKAAARACKQDGLDAVIDRLPPGTARSVHDAPREGEGMYP